MLWERAIEKHAEARSRIERTSNLLSEHIVVGVGNVKDHVFFVNFIVRKNYVLNVHIPYNQVRGRRTV